MTPFIQKIILTVLAVGIYALSAVPLLKDVALLLQPVAGLLIGAAWITKPGDGELVAAGKRASQRPPQPPVPPIAKIGAVFLVLTLGGCAWFNENAKPVLRTIVEVARHLCLLTAEEQDAAARDGLTPAQFCEAEENLRPFIDEVLAAKQRASGKAGLTSGGEAP